MDSTRLEVDIVLPEKPHPKTGMHSKNMPFDLLIRFFP
jgi:hypothetical protein